ncbi:MAG: YceD family protein [Lachnospiraceae bacterium]
MKIDLFDPVSKPGKELSLEVPIELETFDDGMGNYPITKKSPLRLYIKNDSGRELVLKAEACVSITAPCDRCLTDVVMELDLRYEREFPIENAMLVMEDLDVAEFIDGLELDTDQLVYDEILVNWPMKVLCRDDCRGICSKCGCNLNERDCACDRTAVDPRMAAIQDVFNKFKEV